MNPRTDQAFHGQEIFVLGRIIGDEALHFVTRYGAPVGAKAAPGNRSPLDILPSARKGERELTTGLLSKEANFRLIVSGPVGVKEIERLIKKLELDKEILADQEDDEAAN